MSAPQLSISDRLCMIAASLERANAIVSYTAGAERATENFTLANTLVTASELIEEAEGMLTEVQQAVRP